MLQRVLCGRRVAILLPALMGVAIFVPPSSVAFAAGLAEKLVGTWRIVRFTDTDTRGKVTYLFGENPKGYIVYDPTGHLSVQLMRMPSQPPFAAGDDDKGTDAEVRSAYDGYVAYFGTYRVDEAKSVVTHVVEGSLKPSYTGTDRPRPFKLDGDVLIIQGRDKDGSSYVRELHRVK
jgi:Lipocalin-like domain